MNPSVHRLHTPGALQRFVLAVVAAWRATAAAWQRGRRRRAALRELDALDDHLLQDIGVRRCALQSLAAEQWGAAPTTGRATLHCAR